MATANDRELVRRRIEAAGFTLPPDRADEILAAAPLITALTRRVHRAFTYADEPAAVVTLAKPPR